MKKLLTTFFFLVLFQLSFGQITIGDGTISGDLPMNQWYGYNLSQSIYDQGDINQAGIISSIAYYATRNTYTDDVKIYMAEVDKKEFNSATDWVDFSEFELVFDGDFTATTSEGWVTVQLQTEFAYSNTNSLIVMFEENSSGYHSSSDNFRLSEKNSASIFCGSDGTNPDPISPPQGSISNNFPNIQLGITNLADNDLSVKKIEFSNQYPQVGDDVVVSVTVQNTGNSALNNVPVILRRNGNFLSTTNVTLTSLGEMEINYIWGATEGEHEFTAEIDQSDDNDENNNKAEIINCYSSDLPDGAKIAGTLTLANSPYTINGLVTVPVGQTLTIDPGVELQFKTGDDYYLGTDTLDVGGLYVKGKLVAQGTAAQRITFTRQGDEGTWGCIAFHPQSDPTSVFEYCNAEYGNRLDGLDGLSYQGIVSTRVSGLKFSHCQVTGGGYYGIYAYSAMVYVYNSVVSGNARYGIYIYGSNSRLTNNTVVNNSWSGFYDNSSSTVVTNCIFWGNSATFISTSDWSSPYITYCLIQEDIMPDVARGDEEGCIFNISPQLNGDFTLPFNSPCINMGTADTTGLGVGNVDFLNQNRVESGRIDMGATEFQGSQNIVLVSPNGHEGWAGGTEQAIVWRGSAGNVSLEYSTDEGVTWNSIISSIPNDSSYQWQVPAIESEQCRVRVSNASNPAIADMSDNNFTIFTSIIPDSTMLAGRLTIDNSPYTINGLIIVPQGDSLIIDPGVELQFKTGDDYYLGTDTLDVGGLYVKGKLVAQGTAAQRITFTRQGDEGTWGCIAFHPQSDPTSVFEYCNAEYGNRLDGLDGLSYQGIVSTRVSGLKFSHCQVTGGGYYGIYAYSAMVYVYNSVVSGNARYGIYIYGSNSRLTNNTVVNNSWSGFYDNSSSTVVTNCIFWGNSATFISTSDWSSPYITYCLIQEDIMPDVARGDEEGCIFNISPQLNGDFTLPFNSPCINMGTADTTGLGVGNVDFLNQNRVESGRIDMGATEFQGSQNIVLVSPNGHEGWAGGTEQAIVWRGSAGNVSLEYSTDEGVTWNSIISSIPNDSSYQWQVPAIESEQCRVRVSNASNPAIADMSDNNFTIFTSIIPDSTMLAGRLTIDNSPYTINGLIIVPQGDSLIIDPGVELQFKTGDDYYLGTDTLDVGGLYVKGKLVAQGTAAQRITFTRQGDEGTWGCIAFHPQSDPTSVFEYCNAEYGNRLDGLDGLSYQGIVSTRVSGLKFSHCQVTGGGYYGIYAYSAMVYVYNSVVSGNARYGIYIYGSNSRLTNNTVVNNSWSGFYDNSSSTVVTNCIFWGNSATFISTSDWSSPYITYCLIQEDIMPDVARGDEEGCIFNIDPQLNENYELLCSSLAINAGKPDTVGMNIPLVDFLNNPRIFNDTIDIGAIEYQDTRRLRLVNANSIDSLFSDTNYTISWQSNINVMNLEYSLDNGGTWTTIAENITNSNNYNWQVPDVFSYQARIKITSVSDSEIFDISDQPITIFKNETEAHLISYWNFDNYSAKDLISGNDGTMDGAFFGNGFKQNSFINEETGFMSTSNYITPPQDFSIALWFKTEDSDKGKLIEFCSSKEGSNAFADRHLYMNSSGILYFGVNSDEKYFIQSSNSLNDNKWHFVVATCDESSIKLYVDGNKVDEFNGSISANANKGYWKMGFGYISYEWWSEDSDPFVYQGEMDEVKIYDVALTEEQVRNMGVLLCPKYNFKLVPEDTDPEPDSLIVINKSGFDIEINSIQSSNSNIEVGLPGVLNLNQGDQAVLPVNLAYSPGMDSSALRMDYTYNSTNGFDMGTTFVTQFVDDGSELAVYANSALTNYDNCYTENPNSIATMNNLGVLYRLAEDPDRALQILSYAFEKAQDKKVGYSGIQMNTGVVHSDREDSQEAYDYYSGAFTGIEVDSVTSVIAPQIYYNQAWEHFVNDSTENVRIKAWAAINHEKSNDFLIAKAYVLLGVVEAAEDTTLAISYFEESILLDPEGPIGEMAQYNIDFLRNTLPEDVYEEEFVSICDGEEYEGWTESGEYVRILDAANGADSIITTYLTVNPVYNVAEDITICANENYNGWTSTGQYFRTLETINGCDSMVTTNLTVNLLALETEYIEICEGDSYNGWIESGEYQRILEAQNGCDSIVTTFLTVYPVYDLNEDVTICEGEEYNGWDETGQYKRTLSTVNGCDSVVTTNLIVNDTFQVTEYVEICEGEDYNGWTESGEYELSLETQNGCDSIITTILTVHPSYDMVESIIICDGATYNGWEETGQYTRELVSIYGCDSTVTTNLTVSDAYEVTEDIGICEGEDYNGWDESGEYQRTLEAVNGCDSIITSILTVNPVYTITEYISICYGETYNGWDETGQYTRTLSSVYSCDSIVTTNLVVGDLIETTENVDICEGDNYNGWTESGEYTLTLQAQNGCDSIVTTILTVNPVFTITEDITICEGDSYHGWTETGEYTRTLVSINGCDSIVTTYVTVGNAYEVTEYIEICQGSDYNGWDEPGEYQRTFQAQSGCDSIVTTVLTILPVIELTEEVYICEGESYNGWTTAGKYTREFATETGCDSVVTTYLFVRPVFNSTEYVSICEGDSYNGWAESGTYSTTYVSVLGCDSVITMVLTVNESYQTSLNITICNGENYKGWTTSGNYTLDLLSVEGCDSTVNINLTVLAEIETTEEVYICEGEDYLGWTATGIYTRDLTSKQGCDSTVTTLLVVNPKPSQPYITQEADTLTSTLASGYIWYLEEMLIDGADSRNLVIDVSGNYQVAVANDKGCVSDLSEPLYAVSTTTNDPEIFRHLKIYPNPTSGKVVIFGLNTLFEAQVTLIDNLGKVIYTGLENGVSFEINLTGFASGVYYLSIIQDSKYYNYQIIKK